MPARYGMCEGREHRVLRREVVVPGQRRRCAMALAAVAADARVQHGVRGERRRRVVVRRGRVADAAGLVRGVRHVARRQRRAVPVRRRMTEAAVVRRDHLAAGVIGRAALQAGTGRAHVERQARLVAGVAGRADAGMGRLRHVHRPEASRDEIGRVAGTAVGSGERRDVRRREHRRLRVVVVVVERQLRRAAVALVAAGRDPGVQHRDAREHGVVGRRRRVTDVAGLVRGVRHVARRQRRAVPVGGVVAEATVVRRDHLAARVIGRPALQPRTRRAHVERHPGLVTGIASGRHERVLGLRHVRRSEAAGDVVRRMA